MPAKLKFWRFSKKKTSASKAAKQMLSQNLSRQPMAFAVAVRSYHKAYKTCSSGLASCIVTSLRSFIQRYPEKIINRPIYIIAIKISQLPCMIKLRKSYQRSKLMYVTSLSGKPYGVLACMPFIANTMAFACPSATAK